MKECKEVINGIKAIYIMQMPINLDRIDFMSELNKYEAKEVKERGGIDCVILNKSNYKLVKSIKALIKNCEDDAESYFQDTEDGEDYGNHLLSKVQAYKEVIKLITGNKPILL
jgi:hypothetical protein